MCLPPISKGVVPARPNQSAASAAVIAAAAGVPPAQPPKARALPKLAPVQFAPVDASAAFPDCSLGLEVSLSPLLKSPLSGLAFDFFGAPGQSSAFVPDLGDVMFAELTQPPPCSVDFFPAPVPQGMLSPQDSGPFSLSPSLSPESWPVEEPETAQQKRRKRKHASDLSAEELARMREVNRVAAQRHRQLAKTKQADQQRRLDAAIRTNDDLHREVLHYSNEVDTLKRLILSMYGLGGPRSGALAHLAPHLAC